MLSRNKYGRFVLPMLLASAATTAANNEHPFLAATAAAMDRMMAAMTIRSSGDVGRNFEAMMTLQYQRSTDMAVAGLKYGRNDQVKRSAQKIIVDQQQEIASGPIYPLVHADVSQALRVPVIAEAVNAVPGKIIQVQRT